MMKMMKIMHYYDQCLIILPVFLNFKFEVAF